MANYVNYMPSRLIGEANMENAHDWMSRLLEMMPVKGKARSHAPENGASAAPPGTRAQVVGLVGLMRLATLNRGYSRGGVSSALRFACWSCALSAAEKSGPESKTCRSSTATGTHLPGSRLLCAA
jgi:hypothetical protein